MKRFACLLLLILAAVTATSPGMAHVPSSSFPLFFFSSIPPHGADFDDLGTPLLSQQDVRYTGKLFDANSGKHYFNARYLNAVTDAASPELPPRFLSPDVILGSPGNPQSWNRYSYCQNNPINRIDPSGLVDFRTDPTGVSDIPMADIHQMPVLDTISPLSMDVSLKAQVLGFTIMIGGPFALAGVELGGAAFLACSYYRLAPAATGVVSQLVDEVSTGGTGAGVQSTRGPVIIGETMVRVESAAAKVPNATILNDMPEYWKMGLKEHEVTSKMMQYNRKWIHQRLKESREIIDIGVDPNRKTSSIFYQMEKNMVKNYKTLHPGSVKEMKP